MALLGVNKKYKDITTFVDMDEDLETEEVTKGKSELMAGGFNSSKKAAKWIVEALQTYIEENVSNSWGDDDDVVEGDGPRIKNLRQTDRAIEFIAGSFKYTLKAKRERVIAKPIKLGKPPKMSVKAPV